MFSRILVCAISAAVLASAAPADVVREYSHRIWRVQDGLPQNRIQAITQTKDGYLWIGTFGGLVRFDGARFSIFDRSNTPAFRDDSILSLYPSSDGSVWVGTEGGWLLRYSGGQFQRFDASSGLTNGFVRAVHEDKEGTLWVGTDRGFFRLKNGKAERLDNRDGIPVAAITGLDEDQEGNIWAAGGIGLLVVKRGVVQRVLADNEILRGIRNVRVTRDGTLWALTVSGLYRLDKGMLVRHPAIDFTPLTLTEDLEGKLWVGALGQGLVRIGPEGVVRFRDPAVLPDETVVSTFEDQEGDLWVGSQDGLLRLSRTAVRTLTSSDGLADDNVSTIYEDRDRSLWLATITGQLYRYAEGSVARVPLPPSLSGMRVRNVYRDRKETLWLGTGEHGLVRWEGGKYTVFSTKEGLRNNTVRQVLQDRHGDLWIGLGSGLSRWDGTRFHNYYLEDGLVYGSVRVLLEDRNGDILVGTDGGLNRIHEGNFVKDATLAKLDGEKIWALHEDQNGALWVGTRGGGLYRIKNAAAVNIGVRQGLPSSAIYQLLTDSQGSVWMSSPAGVFSAPFSELNRLADGEPGPLYVVPYGTADGLGSAQMNGGLGGSGLRAASGELWFPSVKGAVRIDSQRVRLSRSSPAMIESVTADDRPIPLTSDIRIPAGLGKLQVAFTAASLRSPERISFKYRLEGFEENWTVATERTAYYTNLPPGSYTFHVIARDSATPLSELSASLPILWEPYFYQTRWFYGLLAALAGGMVWLAFRIYARQTQARYALLLAERTRLAREMHDTVIQGCVGVSTLLEAASGFQEENASRAQELTEQARVQVRLTLDEARQAVWDLRNETLDGDVGNTLRELAHQLSAEKGVPIRVEVEGPQLRLPERAIRGILLVTREAIRNAANHGAPLEVCIRMKVEANQVRLEVADDGRGFTPANLSEPNGHYGIVGMKERIEQLGGTFLVKSNPGEGTSIIARLPIPAEPR